MTIEAITTAVNMSIAVAVAVLLLQASRARARAQAARAHTKQMVDSALAMACVWHQTKRANMDVLARNARVQVVVQCSIALVRGALLATRPTKEALQVIGEAHEIVEAIRARVVGNKPGNASMTEADARLIFEGCVRWAAEQLEIPSFAGLEDGGESS